jgi:hypothetical protein
MTHPLRGAIAAALVAAAPLAALAQVSAPAPAPAPARSASGAAPAAQATAYKSAFVGYRRFDDPKVLPWREVNDKVGRIGGWRTYARESADDNSHRGHGDPATPKKP